MGKYNIISESNDSTVVTEYKPLSNKKSTNYQSERDLEEEFIRLLEDQSYEYLNIKSEDDLVKNLKTQLEKLNDYQFSDTEWEQLYKIIFNPNNGISEKTRLIQEDYRQSILLDNGNHKNINLIDKANIHNNILQVINQYEVKGNYNNRYDVTILVNGFPLVHIELKRRGVALKEAFNQINRYQRDSFWAGLGLFEYVQIFVISNGTNTKYYSNTTRFNHVKDLNNNIKKEKTSHSFEFTSFWADAANKRIPDLIDFTRTFFSKHTLLNILTRYCVFTSEELLLVMRPYQIVATERILNKIEIANNYKKYGTIDAGGYIWHATGSGKTLTSFKTAKLASELPYINKVLFVVDRKDLDYQTMREYDRFEKGAANSNVSTEILKRQLENPNSRIIITTIQKLSIFIEKNKNNDIYQKHIVIIFDECHRSQFGKMHQVIIKKFKKYHLFGFTGTPIFSTNATSSGATENNQVMLKTTEQVFGKSLHKYTVVDAISDKNVLPFSIDYLKTFDSKDDIKDKMVSAIDKDRVYKDPKRITKITEYILERFDQKTYRNNKKFDHSVVKNISEAINRNKDFKEDKRKEIVNGFNSIFAVASIEIAKLYYTEFKKQMKENPQKALKVGIIYSYGANEEEADGIIDDENSYDTSKLDKSSRDFLEDAIKDYNMMFNTNYGTSSDKFQNYYKDVSLRMKNKELDILIVVNMFLTGFDATTLNTLWVDKNLEAHGLIQAFSRTNRILNSIKKFGNIVCFRNLQKQVDNAISLFGDKNASGIILIKGYRDYYNGYDDKEFGHIKGYKELLDELFKKYPLTDSSIIGEKSQGEFIKLLSQILKIRNVLTSFDDFKGNEIITDRDFQNYCGRYQDLKDEWSEKYHSDFENINGDVVFEIELLKQIQLNIDYILELIKKYHSSHIKDKDILTQIDMAIASSPILRSKKKLIEGFIKGRNKIVDLQIEWTQYIKYKKEQILIKIIEENNLDEQATRKFVDDCFLMGEVKTTGTDIDKMLPSISRFSNGGLDRLQIKEKVLNDIKIFFDEFSNL